MEERAILALKMEKNVINDKKYRKRWFLSKIHLQDACFFLIMGVAIFYDGFK